MRVLKILVGLMILLTTHPVDAGLQEVITIHLERDRQSDRLRADYDRDLPTFWEDHMKGVESVTVLVDDDWPSEAILRLKMKDTVSPVIFSVPKVRKDENTFYPKLSWYAPSSQFEGQEYSKANPERITGIRAAYELVVPGPNPDTGDMYILINERVSGRKRIFARSESDAGIYIRKYLPSSHRRIRPDQIELITRSSTSNEHPLLNFMKSRRGEIYRGLSQSSSLYGFRYDRTGSDSFSEFDITRSSHARIIGLPPTFCNLLDAHHRDLTRKLKPMTDEIGSVADRNERIMGDLLEADVTGRLRWLKHPSFALYRDPNHPLLRDFPEAILIYSGLSRKFARSRHLDTFTRAAIQKILDEYSGLFNELFEMPHVVDPFNGVTIDPCKLGIRLLAGGRKFADNLIVEMR